MMAVVVLHLLQSVPAKLPLCVATGPVLEVRLLQSVVEVLASEARMAVLSLCLLQSASV